ncbi:hypothetical protein [Rhodobacter sp. SY28-1]|uniref:hypothetical protein n=1 Tax=Rhodobacter sp. SY28-1 TaxID=2562317 RepID=UPI0010C0C7DB|nr:hypothetical protein [Rhodobacter sp. SY28-1]
MTPEVEAELNKIGWARVVDPWQRAWFSTTLKVYGGLVAPSPKAAVAAAKRHRRLCVAILASVEGLTALSDDARGTINLESTPVDHRDEGWPDHVGVAIEALHAISPGLLRWEEFLKHEEERAKRGRPKNEPAYRIASALAEIHLIGKGKPPKVGRLEDGGGPSGIYGQTVANVCALLGIKVADVVPPCLEAVKGLTPERIAAIRIAVNPRSTSQSDARMEKFAR